MIDENSIGFGFFSDVDDEHAWRHVPYDGLESTKRLEQLKSLKSDELDKVIELIIRLQEISKHGTGLDVRKFLEGCSFEHLSKLIEIMTGLELKDEDQY